MSNTFTIREKVLDIALDHTHNLSPVDRAEDALRKLGFAHLRVYHHGDVARIEVPEPDLYQVVARRDRIVEAVRDVGYVHVTLDLQGLNPGSNLRLS